MPYFSIPRGIRARRQVNAIAAVERLLHADFMYFQRAGANECGTAGILINGVRQVNTFVYFDILF